MHEVTQAVPKADRIVSCDSATGPEACPGGAFALLTTQPRRVSPTAYSSGQSVADECAADRPEKGSRPTRPVANQRVFPVSAGVVR